MPLVIINGKDYTDYYKNILNYEKINIQEDLFYIKETILDCSNSNITELPSILSYNITELICANNLLHNLPDLPLTLLNLYCNLNEIVELLELPQTLTDLRCYCNNLIALPNLPITLTNLDCGNNNLTALPNLPITLTNLDCDDNNLIKLPELPQTLIKLSCSYNKLYELPELPYTLDTIICNNNNIKYISSKNFKIIKKYVMKNTRNNKSIINNPFCMNYNNDNDKDFINEFSNLY